MSWLPDGAFEPEVDRVVKALVVAGLLGVLLGGLIVWGLR